jgi:hypothetical protein
MDPASRANAEIISEIVAALQNELQARLSQVHTRLSRKGYPPMKNCAFLPVACAFRLLFPAVAGNSQNYGISSPSIETS